MVGSAICRILAAFGYTNVVTAPRSQVDLTKKDQVYRFFEEEKPHYVFLAAAKVGGIFANSHYPVDFLYENLMIQNHIIKSAADFDVKKLLFLGSSCIYPKFAPQPISEDALLTSALEPTNEPYALAKIAGIKLCQAYHHQYKKNFISAMPTNLYGPKDNYHPQNSHVLPALIRRFYEAKVANKSQVEIWGTGTPMREFLYADDLAEACVFLMQHYDSPEIINVGTGKDIAIGELAKKIATVVGFEGKITFDASKPDGTPKKCLDVSKLTALGWKAKTSLDEGLQKTFKEFLLCYPALAS
jgi:GDP-L-fucose synthase